MAATGIRESNYAPPLHRLLWRFGVLAPPPHFNPFVSNVLFAGTWFGVVWGAFMWSSSGMSWLSAVAAAVIAGLVFGVAMALYYQQGARKHKLPSWSEFKGGDGRVET